MNIRHSLKRQALKEDIYIVGDSFRQFSKALSRVGFASSAARGRNPSLRPTSAHAMPPRRNEYYDGAEPKSYEFEYDLERSRFPPNLPLERNVKRLGIPRLRIWLRCLWFKIMEKRLDSIGSAPTAPRTTWYVNDHRTSARRSQIYRHLRSQGFSYKSSQRMRDWTKSHLSDALRYRNMAPLPP